MSPTINVGFHTFGVEKICLGIYVIGLHYLSNNAGVLPRFETSIIVADVSLDVPTTVNVIINISFLLNHRLKRKLSVLVLFQKILGRFSTSLHFQLSPFFRFPFFFSLPLFSYTSLFSFPFFLRIYKLQIHFKIGLN